MKIYELVHMHGAETLADGRFHYGDCAMLGCFSSAERVAAAIEKYRSIPGFCDYPNGFVVFAHEVEEHAVLVYLAMSTFTMRNMNLNIVGTSVYLKMKVTLDLPSRFSDRIIPRGGK